MSEWSSTEVSNSILSYEDLSFDNGLFYFLKTSQISKKMILSSYNIKNKSVQTYENIKPSSRLYEYGGRSYCISKSYCYYFCSSRASLISHNMLTGKELSLVDNGIFCCPIYTPNGIIFLQDEISTKGYSSICLFSFEFKKTVVLFSNYRYISSPAFNRSMNKLAWVCGQEMPWDPTHLFCADINFKKFELENIKSTKNKKESISYCEPSWFEEKLFCINDSSNWWNLYEVDENMNSNSIAQVDKDFSKPAWVQGKINYFVNENSIIANYLDDSYSKLVEIDRSNKEITVLASNEGYIHEIGSGNDEYFSYVLASPNSLPKVCLFNIKTKSSFSIEEMSLDVTEGHIAKPESIYIDNGIRGVHCLFYPPISGINKDSSLLLKIHGGPTSMSYPALDAKIQYWTSRNFAVLDVNYSGSSGFGKDYRDSLYGNWGQIDAKDCIMALEHIIKEKNINPDRVFARGSSAGGFTILNIAAQSQVIKKISCYYGVTDLTALINTEEQSLESKYLSKLIGSDSCIEALSPINKCKKIKAEVIFFQGLKDFVVPPSQSISMYEKLSDNGIYCEYHSYPNEGHSFKDPDIIADALNKELKFFKLPAHT